MSFGASLRRERELRGITLDEISRVTKISVRLLEAIEADRFDILPEGVFRKSFIRGYARYLGMNEEQVLQEYALEVQAVVSPAAPEVKHEPLARIELARWLRRVVITLAFVLAAVAAGYWYFREARSSGEHSSSIPHQDRLAQTSGSAEPDTHLPDNARKPALRVLGELAKNRGERSTAGISTEAGAGIELVVDVTATCWLSVRTGETVLFSGLMKPSESRKFSLQSPLSLVLGNAGGVKIWVNGQEFASLGESGERRVLEVSPENYQQVLARKTP